MTRASVYFLAAATAVSALSCGDAIDISTPRVVEDPTIVIVSDLDLEVLEVHEPGFSSNQRAIILPWQMLVEVDTLNDIPRVKLDLDLRRGSTEGIDTTARLWGATYWLEKIRIVSEFFVTDNEMISLSGPADPGEGDAYTYIKYYHRQEGATLTATPDESENSFEIKSCTLSSNCDDTSPPFTDSSRRINFEFTFKARINAEILELRGTFFLQNYTLGTPKVSS